MGASVRLGLHNSLCADHVFHTGADVIHPAPGSDGRPSFTALVGNVDSDTAKYVSSIKVQASREEIILDLQEMAKVSVFFLFFVS